MSSSNSNNASYGTMQTEKDKLPLYNTSSRTSTDTTASTDALLQKDSKKGSSDKEKGKVSTKAIINSEFSDLSLGCIDWYQEAAYKNSFQMSS